MSGYPQQHTAYAPPHHQGAYNHQPVPGMQPQTPLIPAHEHGHDNHSHSDHSHSEKGMSRNGEWEHGFCSCCTPFGTCCLGTWCPCILYGRNHYRLEHKGSLDGYSCCNMRCVFYGCLTICSPLQTFLGYFQRKKIRERYGLKGGCCGDCLRHCCCPCCALIQEDKEVVDKTKQASGYHASSGMHYPTK